MQPKLPEATSNRYKSGIRGMQGYKKITPHSGRVATRPGNPEVSF